MGPGRSRLGLLLAAVVVLLAAAAGAVVLLASGEEEREPEVRPAYAARELCAALTPQLPAELALGQGTLDVTADGDRQRARCTFGSARGARLEVEVTGYPLPEGDTAQLDRLVQAACDVVERDFPAAYDGDERACSGRDVEASSTPVEVTAVQVGRVVTRGAVVTVRRLVMFNLVLGVLTIGIAVSGRGF